MKQTEQIVEILDKIGELTERFESILVVLEEFESDLTDTCSSDVECQSEEGVMSAAEGNGLGPSADVECLAKQDQATQLENQGTGAGVSGAVQSHGDKLGGVTEGRENQKLMALKSSSSTAGMAYQAKTIKTLAGRVRSGSATLGGVMVGGAAFGVGALVIGASRLHPKLMTGVGKAGKVALPKVAGSVVRVSKLAGKAAKFAGTVGKMGMIGSVGTSAAKVGLVGLKIGGAALSAVGLGFDIWSIVSTAKDMSEGSKLPAGVQLRDRSREIEETKEKSIRDQRASRKVWGFGSPSCCLLCLSIDQIPELLEESR